MAASETPAVSARPGSIAQAALSTPQAPSAMPMAATAPRGHGQARCSRQKASTTKASATSATGAMALDCSTAATGARTSATASGRAGEVSFTRGKVAPGA